MLTIRRATAGDVDALSAISRDTFVETFGHLYTPQDLATHLDTMYAPEKYRDAIEEQGAVAWLLIDDENHVQGYAYAGPCSLPHQDVHPGDLELKRLYLRRTLQNGGWGAKLFAEAEAWMRRNGPASIWIGVWSENSGAQRFYARHGYEKVGEYLYPVGETRDLEFILKKSLAE